MAVPSPTPEVEQLELVAEIMLVPSELVLGLVSAYPQEFADVKWGRTLLDLDRWPEVIEDSDIKKVGPLEFFNGTANESLVNFRNVLRQRYGLALLGDSEDVVVSSAVRVLGPVGGAVAVSADW